MAQKKQARLTPTDWMRTAFQNLALSGVTALKAEVLAKQLQTTKGSFYWHFKDVPAFRRAMLKLWEAEATTGIVATVNSAAASGPERLKLLSHIVSQMNAVNDYGGLRAEPAIRDWARTDRLASAALRKVDAARIAYVTGLFAESGFDTSTAKMRAELFYSGFLGLQAMAATHSIDIAPRMDAMLHLLLAKP
jgi:AcrR family transcriptional regulator